MSFHVHKKAGQPLGVFAREHVFDGEPRLVILQIYHDRITNPHLQYPADHQQLLQLKVGIYIRVNAIRATHNQFATGSTFLKIWINPRAN
jgi:hypothetical protein